MIVVYLKLASRQDKKEEKQCTKTIENTQEKQQVIVVYLKLASRQNKKAKNKNVQKQTKPRTKSKTHQNKQRVKNHYVLCEKVSNII